jgi:hypothetical protein
MKATRPPTARIAGSNHRAGAAGRQRARPATIQRSLRQPSLRSQLNQIRLWVRQGRTDAWIAHKLDISVEQLEQFKRDHLSEPEPAPPESAPEAREEVEVHEQVEAPEQDEEDEDGEPEAEAEAEPEPETQPSERARRRRRGRRGGRRRTGTRSTASYEGTFDHGGEGYGLWLDPAVADSQVYAEHWAGHRAVTVTVDADSITIRRIDDNAENTEDDAAEPLEP